MTQNNLKNGDTRVAPVVLFDGVCKLCNGSVNFILPRDQKGQLKLAPLQSNYGRQVLASHEIKPDWLESILLLEGDQLFVKSTAIIRITKYLNGLWPLCMTLLLIPRFIRDFVYDMIAKNRYRWFGKYDTCRLPNQDYEDRFYA
jgi:predicted DCC family thiol-disulfide oxidoreductase YuxK